MIPITSFAGRTRSPLFGLGGSGLASAQRAAGRRRGLSSRSTTARHRREGDRRRHQRPPTCARSTGRSFAALVLAPGVPLTHPRAALEREAGATAGVEIIGDIELFCRERRSRAPRAPFVAITGTNGKSTTTALIAHILRARRRRRADGRQYRHRDPVAGAAGARPLPRDRMLVLPDRSCAFARSLRRHSDQHLARPSRSPRHDRALRRGEGAAGRQLQIASVS